jgi:hypothetical protein
LLFFSVDVSFVWVVRARDLCWLPTALIRVLDFGQKDSRDRDPRSKIQHEIVNAEAVRVLVSTS